MWKVPLSDVKFSKLEEVALQKVIKSGWLSMGNRVKEFEKNFSEFLKVKYSYAVSCGTAALHLACVLSKLSPMDEVICPSLTFIATSNAILYCKAKPVFVDITSLENLNMCVNEVEELISDKTKAILVVHYGGYPVDMSKLREIAKKRKILIIEDASHAVGASFRNKMCGSIGDIGCFSFFSNKNLATGEGGMIVTNKYIFAERIKLLRSHGMTTLTWDRYKGHSYSYDVIDLGFNYRMDELRAALGIVQLSKLTKNNEKRKSVVKKYIKHIDQDNVIIPFRKFIDDGINKPSFHIFPIILKDRKIRARFMSFLKSKGIQTSIHYPPIHLFKYYSEKFGINEGFLPRTELVGKSLITLPLFPSMTQRQIDYVIENVNKGLKI